MHRLSHLRCCRTLIHRPQLVSRRFNGTDSTLSNTDFASTLITYNHPTAPLATFNKRLSEKLRYRSSPKRVLQEVLAITNEIKSKGLKFDLNTYNALLAAYMRARNDHGVLKTLRDMKKNDVKPTLESYNTMLEAFGITGQLRNQAEVIEDMKQNNVSLSLTSYTHLLRGACTINAIEHALDIMEKMKAEGIQPNAVCYTMVIGSCSQLHESETAFALLKEAEEADMVAVSNPRMYLEVLRTSAFNDAHEQVEYCWDKAINSYGMRPDEGTCLDVLRVAAKSGDAKLATDVIRQLSTSGFPYKEYYFSPLMEAFVVKKDLKSAFNVLDIMRVSGVAPSSRTTLLIRRHLRDNIDAIDNAYYLLEELKNEGRNVDVTAFNAIVEACAEAKDLQRTVATYREAKNLDVVPDVDTYNAVLEACVQTANKGMGNVVIKEMKKVSVMPNVETYTKMIALSCTQRNYEDAFSYLEEMKSYGVIPPQSCYDILTRKLAAANDPRFHMALEEMETFGYAVTTRTRALWQQ
ncbi:hypothetical protein BDA99DRAFT_533652 [Phascolomyces articulosus]|uniref:Pentatricopeptide repeat-containing protein-mitochondrial domain-containing protein n=1 Tax=Phascolomyces articulosus TaxID=60185 RepID=A0AAD5K7B5_9FUNG|nr:hypothetical protein BDA99DRAFT_533652 [Phascolomyces articulosus]